MSFAPGPAVPTPPPEALAPSLTDGARAQDEPAAASSLKLSAIEGAVSAVMTGTSESYMGAFAVALGHSDLHLALLTTAPYLCGAVAQLFARKLVDVFGSRKRMVVAIASTQVAVHAGMIAIALTGSKELLPLLVVNVAYWTCGMAVVPTWNAWMATLTQNIDRGRYFALRSVVAQVGLLSSFAAGGFAMEHGRTAGSGAVLVAYALVAGAGGVARSISALLLSRQHDPGEPGYGEQSADADANAPSSFTRLKEAASSSSWGAAFFVVAFQLGANIAVPFFAPYMLKTLRFDFVQYMELLASAILVKALVLPLWSRAGRRFGWRRPLVVATVGTAFVALGWSIFTSFHALAFVQALSGVAWAGLELASFQLLLVAAPARHRVGFFALSTSMTATAQVAGSLLGTALLAFTPSYPAAFFASSILRALAVAWLWPRRRISE